MKKLITLILMVTIQMTFMQKVIASVQSLDKESVTIEHCAMSMMQMSEYHCSEMLTTMNSLQDCQSDCEMMNVVSVTHFIENTFQFSSPYTQLSYSALIVPLTNAQSKSLYRPPLLS